MRITKLIGLLDQIKDEHGDDTQIDEVDVHAKGEAVSVYYTPKNRSQECQMLSLADPAVARKERR